MSEGERDRNQVLKFFTDIMKNKWLQYLFIGAILIALMISLSGCPDKNINNIIEADDIIVEPFEWEVVCDDIAGACILYKLDGSNPRVIFKYLDQFNRVHLPDLCRGWLK